MDILGASIAFKLAGMSTRQGICFFTCLTLKTVDDHCGYSLPWDPFQQLTNNNAGYHDIHHQSWGIKVCFLPGLSYLLSDLCPQTNFSQPCFTFWDRFLGTMWVGGDVSVRYERARVAAQQKVDLDNPNQTITLSSTDINLTQDPTPSVDQICPASDSPSVPATNQTSASPREKPSCKPPHPVDRFSTTPVKTYYSTKPARK